MKKNIIMLVIAVVFLSSQAWGFGYNGKTVVAQNSAPKTTKSNVFVPKPIPITPAMVKAAMSYTDAQDIRAEISGLKKEIQILKKEDSKIWSEIKGLSDAIGKIKAMVKTAIDGNTTNAASIQKLIDNDVKIEKKVADLKIGLPTMMKEAIEDGTKGIANQVETLRKIGILAFIGFGIVIIGIFILALFPIRKKN